MTMTVREKFSSQAELDVLAALRQIVESQGREFQTVLDDALRDYIVRLQKERPVTTSWQRSRPASKNSTCSTATWPSKPCRAMT